MKSYGGLWEKIVSDENLREAWNRVKRGRSRSRRIQAYGRDIDRNLANLRHSLLVGSYAPGPYRQFRVMDPKPRTISCAPVGDRVVHHALCGVVAPLWERRFIARSYACRVGKGTHIACREARRELAGHAYFLKLDVRHYFQSIDHDILLGILNPMFRERELRHLLEQVVRHPVPGNEPGKGVPIGNLTSQWFANLYLDGLDHYVADELGAGRAYFRYMDDLLIFCANREEAQRYHALISAWLSENRRLELKECATFIGPVRDGVPFLGLRIWKDAWRLKRSRFLHARRAAAGRMRQYEHGEIGMRRMVDSLQSICGSYAWFGFDDVLNGISAPGEMSLNAAAVGTTVRPNCAALAAMVTMASATRTTTMASAFSAPFRGGSHPVKPALRPMEVGDEHAAPSGTSRWDYTVKSARQGFVTVQSDGFQR